MTNDIEEVKQCKEAIKEIKTALLDAQYQRHNANQIRSARESAINLFCLIEKLQYMMRKDNG